MERLGTLPFIAQPGEAYVYGYNTDILGCIAEKASGMPLDELIRTRITGPLGMKDTQFYLPPAQRDRLAAVYGSNAASDVQDLPRARRAAGTGQLRRRSAAQFRRRRRAALDGARLRAIPRGDPPRRRDRRRPHPVAAHRGADDDESERHAALRRRARLRLRLRDDGSLRRERDGIASARSAGVAPTARTTASIRSRAWCW